MSNWARVVYVGAVIMNIGAVYIVYARAGLPLLHRLENSAGPFGKWVLRLEGLVPLLLGLLLLASLIYLLVGPIQQEKSRDITDIRRRGR